jgi:hypothetical protein
MFILFSQLSLNGKEEVGTLAFKQLNKDNFYPYIVFRIFSFTLTPRIWSEASKGHRDWTTPQLLKPDIEF